jgi:hypothetical protein
MRCRQFRSANATARMVHMYYDIALLLSMIVRLGAGQYRDRTEFGRSRDVIPAAPALRRHKRLINPYAR